MINLDENLNEVDDGLDNEPEGYWSVDDVPDNQLTMIEEKHTKQYVVDFNKVNTLEDVILIIKAMNLHILASEDGSGQFEEVFHMLKRA